MTLNTLASGEPWMTPDERDLNHHLVRAIAESLAAAGVCETALVALRVNDVAVTWLLARRLELVLTPTEAEPAPCPTPAQANAIGKCRERLRRAIKELEGCRTRTRAKSAPSLADHIYETMRMLEDSLPLTETPPANSKTTPESERRAENPNPTDNPPVTAPIVTCHESMVHQRERHKLRCATRFGSADSSARSVLSAFLQRILDTILLQRGTDPKKAATLKGSPPCSVLIWGTG